MIDNDVSHAMLYAQVLAMRSTLDEHVERAKDNREDIREIRRKLEDGTTTFRAMGEAVAELRTNVTAVVRLQTAHDTSIRGLEAKENVRVGQQGVWRAILSSKPVLWLAGVLSALAAAIFHKGNLP